MLTWQLSPGLPYVKDDYVKLNSIGDAVLQYFIALSNFDII